MMFVYRVTNILNGKQYIGITEKHVEKRWRQHVYKAFHNPGGSSFLRAIKKYGAQSFVVETLLRCEMTRAGAGIIEMTLIAGMNTMVPNGYNIGRGGDGGGAHWIGRKHFAETIAKMQQAHRDRKLSGQNLAVWTGRKHKPESIERMRIAQKGHISTPERNAKIAATLRRCHQERNKSVNN